MLIKNNEDRYGIIAIALHWLVALGFLGAYMSVYYRHWFTDYRTPENWTALQLHLSFGVTVGVFVLLRVIWKMMNKTPKEEPGTALEHFAAHSAHWVLYAVMIVMPITGYLGTGVATEYFFLGDIPKFADTALFQNYIAGGMGLTFEEFEKPLDVIHKTGGKYVVWVLILLHAAAALYHHFVRRDRVLKRMVSTKWE